MTRYGRTFPRMGHLPTKAHSRLAYRPRKLNDPYTYTVRDAAGRAVGFLTLWKSVPPMRVIEVGFIVY